ncbi:hypothetical protein BOTBODRAFT_611361 [Botryobasidium botryosum FD-172 SS1]|uniref:DNA endonuclease activator Ctp1 C-terminal domain-containing protein n=1 Tax=Botryobasidium botryosum (strain FD-172 SS1) TaxID=930990 RepID=A0A067LW42_BOTB1|nr:hypothetical protein BOTBODRAFT_611361 [Botryobasidium botryosum FD-172 SS1]
MYEINRDQNQGLSFEFDEVVRNKAARKRMEAGDCLECREYYEAVGPLPPRLAAPLWRSPSPQSSSQPKEMPIRPPCRHHMVPEEEHAPAPAASPAKRSKAINQHKKEISRHRHYWAPPTTPPGFWNIGFPSTQEVEEINRQAKEMHEKKREWMEREANKPDGKYRKRA